MDSKLQIISGTFRGRKLRMPASARPTQNRARIALFNMIESLGIRPCVAWDVFAGSGAFGFEILSRFHDAKVYFSDTDAGATKIIRDNLNALNIGDRATVRQCDAISMIDEIGAKSDLIFLDPPYADAAHGRAFVANLTKYAHNGTILIWEQDAADAILPPTGWGILRDKQYGRARFMILERVDE